MKHAKIILLCITSYLLSIHAVRADDWMTWASTYTHDAFGQRVDQHALPVDPIAPDRSSIRRSGFRHFRSTLQAGQSADNMHVVEEWGGQVIPYEQWRFPFRPFAVPYDAWGPQAPYGFFNGGFGAGPWRGGLGPAFPGGGNPGVGNPGMGFPGGNFPGPGGSNGFGPNYGGPQGFPLQPDYRNQPWFDGTYPDAPPLDPRSDAEFFYRPRR